MLWLKHLHVSCVVLSACGFALRGWWRLTAPQRLRQRWVRTVPHMVDSTLFFSGLALLWLYRWWPQDQPWLMAKMIALLVYILLGAVALRQGRLWQIAAAMAVFAYIVSVALTRTPLAWLS
ncbi:MAG: SirB2 family protein [Thiohalomonadaceae bacterium]